jgi:hypothetical protein
MTIDRWEQRSGLWVRRRDDGDWDYFPSLREPASGYRVKAAFFHRLDLADHAGKAVGYGLGLPLLCFALVILATHLDLGFLSDRRAKGLIFIVGLIIVVGAGFARPMARQAALKRAVASDTILSPDELRDLVRRFGSASFDDLDAPRPAISGGARSALTLTMAAIASLAVLAFLVALAIGLETTMLVTGILTLLCGLVAMRLWQLSRVSL